VARHENVLIIRALNPPNRDPPSTTLAENCDNKRELVKPEWEMQVPVSVCFLPTPTHESREVRTEVDDQDGVVHPFSPYIPGTTPNSSHARSGLSVYSLLFPRNSPLVSCESFHPSQKQDGKGPM